MALFLINQPNLIYELIFQYHLKRYNVLFVNNLKELMKKEFSNPIYYIYYVGDGGKGTDLNLVYYHNIKKFDSMIRYVLSPLNDRRKV